MAACKATKNAEKLRAIADKIRSNPHAREAIAEGFELIAEAMTPCEDCASKQGAPARAPRAKAADAAKKAA